VEGDKKTSFLGMRGRVRLKNKEGLEGPLLIQYFANYFSPELPR
jgi:hypothetical protein